MSGRSAVGVVGDGGIAGGTGAPGRGGGGVGAPGATAPTPVRSRPVENIWLRSCASSWASEWRRGMIWSSSTATSTSTSLTMSSTRRMLAAVSVMMRRFVSRWAEMPPCWGTKGRRRIHGIRRADVLQRNELGQDLVPAARRICLASDDRSDRGLGRAFLRDDAIEVTRLDGGQAVDVEDGQQHIEDVVVGDLADGLDRHLSTACRRGQHVVEADDLGGGLDDHLHVGIVEVEHDVARGCG